MITNRLRKLLRANNLEASRGRLGRSPFKPSDVYASHLPVLVGISQLLRITSVLELGAGRYSSRLFLDRAVFSHLERLHTVEDDAEWARTIREQFSHDSRFCLTEVPGPVRQAIHGRSPKDYDLIFIDDSKAIEERSETIRAVAAWASGTSLVVIHDAEQPAYQLAAIGIPHRVVLTVFHPATALLWYDLNITPESMQELDQNLRQHAKSIDPVDTHEWKTTFSQTA